MISRLKLAAQRVLAWFTYRLVGPRAMAVLVQTSEGDLLAVDPQDQGVGRQLRWHGVYQARELARLKRLIQPRDHVLVVGAHIGALVLPLARVCEQLVAIEANPLSFTLLRLNLNINAIPNCQALQLAANHETGELRFLQSRTNSGGSKRDPLHRDARYMHDRPREVMVRAERLDNTLAGQRFDVVLMDIEGSEVFALRGMPRLLLDCRCLVVEFLPHHLQRVSGASVAEFLQAIPDHLAWMQVPSTGQCVAKGQALVVLEAMARRNTGDDGLVFSTEPL